MLVCAFTACSKSNNIDEVIDENIDTKFDMSLIDISNIDNLYAQPLPVIQKCLEGNWSLVFTYGGIEGKTIVDVLDSFMQITKERIVIGDNANGVRTNSLIEWIKLEKFYDNRDAHVIGYNYTGGTKSPVYGNHLFPYSIKSDTLLVWDLCKDGYFGHYIRNNNIP